MTLTDLATKLAEAVVKDEAPDAGGFDLSAGMYGEHVSNWLRDVATELETRREQSQTKDAVEMVTCTVDFLCDACGEFEVIKQHSSLTQLCGCGQVAKPLRIRSAGVKQGGKWSSYALVDAPPVSALDFLKSFPHLPMQMHGNQPVKASNAELRRWLESGSVIINGEKPKPKDLVTFPVWQLIFFPNGKRRTTMQDVPSYQKEKVGE